MSVISNITTIHFINKTNYFIEIKFNGEQASNLVITHNSKNVITKSSFHITDYLWSFIFGEETNLVHINLLPKNKIELKIKCNANLFFQIHPKIKDCTESDYGEFQLNTEYQNTKLDLEITDSFGIGYTENGDVAINTVEPCFRDLCIHSRVYYESEELNLDYRSAFCKIKL
tara:strand:- start:1556 stop:2071 length:516 start_codon:yes stop_codon:yes gene_type:complete